MASKKIILFITLILTSLQIQAQVKSIFGLKTGANFSTFINSNNARYQISPGFIFGTTLELKSSFRKLSIQSGFLFFQYGAKFRDSNVTAEINYFKIPLLFKYRLDTPLSDRSPTIIFGTFTNLHLISNKRIPGFLGLSVIDDAVDTPNYGLIIGTGYDINSISIGIQSNFGLSKTFRSKYQLDEKNVGISITFAVKL